MFDRPNEEAPGEGFTDKLNPYAVEIQAPSTFASAFEEGDVESIRWKFLKHEASIQSMGSLFLLGGVFSMLVGGIYLFMAISDAGLEEMAEVGEDEQTVRLFFAGLGLILGCVGLAQMVVAIALRRLKPWARIGGSVFSAIGLMAVPIGTLISIYMLWLLLSKKGEYVFSSEYREVIDATPHIRYRSSCLLITFVVFLVLVVIGFAVAIVRP